MRGMVNCSTLAFQGESYTLTGPQKLDGFHAHTWRQLHPDGLRAERVDRLHPSMVGVGIGVVEQVNGISGGGLPTEHLDEAFTFNVNDALVAGDPADGVVQQSQQIAVAGEPVASLDVSGEVGRTAGACFAQHNCRLIGVRDRRVGQLRWIPHEAWDDGEHGILYGLERDAILRAGEPVGVAEALKDGVLALRCGA